MPDEKEVKIKYEKSKDYKMISANGAFGGVSPQGDNIVFHLFTEFSAIPLHNTVILDGDNKFLYETQEVGDYAGVRELQMGVVMSPQAARSLGNWLIERVSLMEKELKANEDETISPEAESED